MNDVLANSYNATVKNQSQTLYDICTDSHTDLLTDMLNEYSHKATIFLYGDTKDELIEDVKSYKDYRVLTNMLLTEYIEMLYQQLKEYTKKMEITTFTQKPDKAIQQFIAFTAEHTVAWQTETLLPTIADMAQGDKDEYSGMIKQAYRECVIVTTRVIAVAMCIALENYEEYLFDQMEEKDNHRPEVYFVMSTLHGYITERISMLSDLALDARKRLNAD